MNDVAQKKGKHRADFLVCVRVCVFGKVSTELTVVPQGVKGVATQKNLGTACGKAHGEAGPHAAS